MRDINHRLLVVLAGGLTLWLVLGFWPLPLSGKVALSLLTVLMVGMLLWRPWREAPPPGKTTCDMISASLPPEDFQGAVVLVCGDGAPLFSVDSWHRETRQGWYVWVPDAEHLPMLAQHLSQLRPALTPQTSVLLAILPEHHTESAEFTQSLRGWQRALVQCRPWLGGLPPFWTVTWVSPPRAAATEDAVWFTATGQHQTVQAHHPERGCLSLADGLQHNAATGRFTRLSQLLWLDSLLSWQKHAVDALLSEPAGDVPVLTPCVQGFCLTPVSGWRGNLWQQAIASVTTLPPESISQDDGLPLPERLLAELPQRRGISKKRHFWGYIGLLAGAFLALAMLASFFNNQRLIQRIADHLTLYQQLSDDSPAAKAQAQHHLREDSRLLDGWLHRGEPLRYRFGLYQGLRLLPVIDLAISRWSPPLPTPPAPQGVARAAPLPHTLRLDSLSLFDSGQAVLKSSATKTLVNSLVGIKARDGWLIVVSGHTDNTGNPQGNQALSLQRAIAVRDWMRDTGDVPEHCFAVQGYGASHPVASNDTAQGRALNRRVEIRLVPQADACQVPGVTPASSLEDDAKHSPNGE